MRFGRGDWSISKRGPRDLSDHARSRFGLGVEDPREQQARGACFVSKRSRGEAQDGMGERVVGTCSGARRSAPTASPALANPSRRRSASNSRRIRFTVPGAP